MRSVMYNRVMKYIVLLCMVLFIASCAHVMPEEVRAQIDEKITTTDLFREPEAYTGVKVMLGGMIIESRNTNTGTFIEVLQKPLDRRGRPRDIDESVGRFIVQYDGYLDTALYAEGKSITVAGEVLGTEMRPLGETDYRYIILKSIKLKLVDPARRVPVRFSIGVGASF